MYRDLLVRLAGRHTAGGLAPLVACLVLQAGTWMSAADVLVGRAVLPADTFAEGPTSGATLGAGPINGREVPFEDSQPVQGFSAILDNGDGTYSMMSDNGFGSLENSADYHLRVYQIRPEFKTAEGGSGEIEILGFIELHDPDEHIPWTITNFFTEDRILTGADFDIESFRRTPDGTLWFGDEFGPFLIHTDADGRVLEAPIPLPDFANGGEIRSPQSPLNEEASAVRTMNAVRVHAQSNGNSRAPVFSPWHVMLDDGNPDTLVENRAIPPEGSGLAAASSELFNVASIQSAGYPVVVWTVNDKPRMLELMELGVDGIISDRPDLLLEAAREFNGGEFLDADGLIDITRFDAQGHRGGRNLRPENTLPAMEVALDNLMTTLELDNGVTSDGIPVLNHDPYVESTKSRKADGSEYGEDDEVLIKDLTAAEIQSTFICDKLLEGRPEQTSDLALSPVSVAFAGSIGLMHPYVMPTLQQVFDFVDFYVEYYTTGAGSGEPDAALRAANAARVRYNIETKINPRSDADGKGNVFAERTIEFAPFASAVAGVIAANTLEERADIQSFGFQTLLVVQEEFPAIRTVYLFGDFPIFEDRGPGSDDGTNLQDESGANTPWLAGLVWPYRVTALDHPFRAQRSGGFEGMALTSDAGSLLPLLEQPLVGSVERVLLIHEFDLATTSYTGTSYRYPLDERGAAIGDFTMFDESRGLIIERDNSQGDLGGYKAINGITLPGLESGNDLVTKKEVVNLLDVSDPNLLSLEGAQEGDVGVGETFAFPFVTIEDVFVIDERHIGVLNDNNYPFSIGRHVGTGDPDDNEFVILELDEILDEESNVFVSFEPLGGGRYDVVVSTEIPFAGFSLGIEVTGGCEGLGVTTITPGPDLPSEVSFFQAKRVGSAQTLGVVLDLEPPGDLLGPGEDLRVATVLVCGHMDGEEGCQLGFSNELGTPPVKTTFSTELGVAIPTATGSVPLSDIEPCFRRGEANDDVSFDVADAINILGFLFMGGQTICLDALDSNDDGVVNVSDSNYILNFLFVGGPETQDPGYESCGPDPTDDALDCEDYTSC